jgi:hypothetical protein
MGGLRNQNSLEEVIYSTDGRWNVTWNKDSVLLDLYFDDPLAPTPVPSAKLTTAKAKARVLQVTAVMDVDMGDPDEFAYSPDLGLWVANWHRLIDGYPTSSGLAPDGIEISVYLDGTFRDYSYQWSPVADKPAKVITRDQALSKAAALCRPHGCTAQLTWWRTEPNQPMVLTWHLMSKNAECHADEWRDAGTGEVLSISYCM